MGRLRSTLTGRTEVLGSQSRSTPTPLVNASFGRDTRALGFVYLVWGR